MSAPEVWAVWPTISVERSLPIIDRWHERGYKVALLVNPPLDNTMFRGAEMVIVQEEWLGFPMAANILCAEALGDIVVVAGDDLYPDENQTAQEIGEAFRGVFPDLMGVMQPTGDQYGCYDKCAVSPWIGRKFINAAYGGIGPYWPGYFHYFCDEELQEYAIKLGCFQQRSDILQYHDHWQRKEGVTRPKHLFRAKREWRKDKRTFENRKQKGFPH